MRTALYGILAAACTAGCSSGRGPSSLYSSQKLPDVGRGAPNQYVFRASQYAFTTDFELAPDDPLVTDLAELRDEVFRTLKLPQSDLPIRIVIFDSQQAYHEFLKRNFPNLPDRRAFFIREGRDSLAVFACRGDRLRADLRHEATHALLHSRIENVPIWLDEGLAEYFETSREPGGVNPTHAHRLRAIAPQGWVPDLKRLEGLQNLWQMTQDDYRESWLWVHYLLRHSPETRRILIDHVAGLAAGRDDAPLSAVVASADPERTRSLLEHLESLKPYLRY